MTNKYNTDIAIIGAGPAGLFAAFEAGMLNMKCHIIDILDHIGGQCTALYTEKPIYDIPAYSQIMAGDLIKKLEEQIAPFNPTFHLNNQVNQLEKTDEGWKLITDKGKEISAKAVVIAAGCGAFGPHKPPLENIEEYEKKGGVQYLVKSIESYRGKNIAIAGGGDSAIDWVLSLSKVANKVYLIHRRAKFRAAPHSLNQLDKLVEEGKLELVVPYQLHKLGGQDGILESLEVISQNNDIKKLKIDTLLPFFGLSMELGPITNWGLALDKKHINVNPATMETNIEGIFAIGDIASYPGKLKLILTGFSEAAQSLHNSYKYVFPGKALHFQYSTTKGVS